LYNLTKGANETKYLSYINTSKFKEMAQLIEEWVIDLQKEMVTWSGQEVLLYEVAKMYNLKLPSVSVFKKFSPEKQDIAEGAQ
jgi:hypothetical protein